MYADKRVLAIVPARGGSKGIPGKNIVDLCGKPLIVYSIEAGLNSKYIDYLMVSTDSEKIAEISKNAGAHVPFMRPEYLATDEAKTVDVVIHSIDCLRRNGLIFDILVLLQPTQPLRSTEDIDRAIEKYVDGGCLPLISVCETDTHPLHLRSIEKDRLRPFLDMSSTCRRQDMSLYYRVNGCIYINAIDEIDEKTSFNDNCIPFIMPRSRSVDIDEPVDLAIAEYYLKNHG